MQISTARPFHSEALHISQFSVYNTLPPQVKSAPLPFPGLRGLSVLSA